MEVRNDLITLERAEERGTHVKEIKDVIETGISVPGKYGREVKVKTYEFKRRRFNKYFEQKKVEVFYTNREDAIITLTVYVFYGRWEYKHANRI